jgi:hypothetical protein
MNINYKMVDIDFDEASLAWRANKKSIGRGYFAYKCAYIHTHNGKHCRRPVYEQRYRNLYECHPNFEVGRNYNNHPNRSIFCKKHLNRYVNDTMR